MGKIATNLLAQGDGWTIRDVVCGAGPQDKPFEEQHSIISMAVVLEGSFQYRSGDRKELMTPGSLMLGNAQQRFCCSHEHGTGDRCVAFHYTPEFFEQAKWKSGFSVLRIPPIAGTAPWVALARIATQTSTHAIAEELVLRLAGSALERMDQTDDKRRVPTAGDERRISTVLRFVEANLADELPLARLASLTKMTNYHFLRVFKQVTGVTPHQYILRARLREAASKLKVQNLPVLDVALDVGFRDLSTFNHAFRAEFGMNPKSFRGKH